MPAKGSRRSANAYGASLLAAPPRGLPAGCDLAVVCGVWMVNMSDEVPAPDAMLDGEKIAVAPVGRPLVVSVTVAGKVEVLTGVPVMLKVVVPPGSTVAEASATLSVKSGVGGAAVPVPLIEAVCGEFAALSTTDNPPETAAVPVGLKVYEKVQKAPAASVAPQLLDSTKALEPEKVMPVMLNAALPGFERVMV